MSKVAAKDKLLKEAYDRYDAQLGDWNIDLSKELWREGSQLEFDPKSEKFVGGKGFKRANGRLKRTYRKEFEVPVKV